MLLQNLVEVELIRNNQKESQKCETERETNKKQSKRKSEKKIEKEKLAKAFKMEDEDAITENLEFVNIDKREENCNSEALQHRTENNLGVEIGELVKDRVDGELFIGETVLFRYYEKKCWKYYIGVIKLIDFDTNMYTIFFYKTVSRKENLKFIVPKRTDRDIVPYVSIVKKIQLQKQEKPNEFKLMNMEDYTYFD
ncbi:unnamed protein product [Parnassius apollo]|uniref:(apollo) hypothetical protein n=1 Tax=Parnassius apollo TaxID=110799 RepID=A0A8S3X437_PARAO|nr:unnamed protein product [Parnassius apollo]